MPVPILTAEEVLTRHPLTSSLLNLAIEGFAVGVLKGGKVNGICFVTPKHFLLWLAQKNWELPNEMIEVLKDKGLLYPSSKKKGKDSTAYYKQKIQTLALDLAQKLERFNQEEIYQHQEMQRLLQDLGDPYGGKRKPFARVTVKRWISEVDKCQLDERRGRPKKKKIAEKTCDGS